MALNRINKNMIDPSFVQDVENTKTQLADTTRVVNAKSMGAKGDGKTDDWAALQEAINRAESLNRPLYIPEGKYFISQTLRTRHQRTYNYTPGITIYGAGKETIILGRDERVPATYGNGKTNMSDQALLAIHGSNNNISNLMFQGGKVGLFLGQDPRTTESGSVGMNIMEKLWFYYNGTAILYQNGDGCHYNKTRDVHIAHAQIGIHLGKGLIIDRVNNNRNSFDSIRVARSWIGYLLEEGDGNFFNKVYSETIQTGQAIGSAPAQLPSELNGKPSAIVILDSQYVPFDNFAHEACDWDIYSTGFRCSFVNGMIKDDSPTTLKVMFPNPVRQPLAYTANSLILGGMHFQPTADTLFPGSNGTGFKLPVFDVGYARQTIDLLPLCAQMKSKTSPSRSRFHRLGQTCDWMINYRFDLKEGTIPTEPLKILIPFYETLSVGLGFKEALTGNQTFPFKVIVGRSSPLEKEVFARFSTDAEASAFGGYHLIIPPPDNGWNITANTNYLFAQLRYHA